MVNKKVNKPSPRREKYQSRSANRVDDLPVFHSDVPSEAKQVRARWERQAEWEARQAVRRRESHFSMDRETQYASSCVKLPAEKDVKKFSTHTLHHISSKLLRFEIQSVCLITLFCKIVTASSSSAYVPNPCTSVWSASSQRSAKSKSIVSDKRYWPRVVFKKDSRQTSL